MGIRQNLGRYEILAELGHGAMGVVYKARDPQIDRLVAIKTISLMGQNPDEEGDYLTRFFLEARAAGRLSHPGIVTIFDVGEEPGTRAPYIVMEHVSGQALSKLLEVSSGKLPLETALQITQQLAEALDYAHTHGVVHRDMKPSNVLMTDEGRAKIADFGIAKMNLAQITLPGNVLGTPAFMSPEQLEGGTVDGRSDLFSLGVILYTILTGHRPFQGNSALTVSFKVANREPVPATAFDSDFPPEIDYVIARAMAKDPAERYQTGREMALDINELLRGRMPRSQGDGLLPNPGASLPAAALNILRGTQSNQLSKLASGQSRRSSGLLSTLRNSRFAGAVAATLIALVTLGITFSHPRGTAAPAAPPPQAAVPTVATPVGQTPPAKALPVENAILQFQIDHQFADGTLTFWIDGKLARTQAIHGESKRKLVLFHGTHGDETGSLRVAAGKHHIRVRVVSTAGFNQSRDVAATFAAGTSTYLEIKCDKTNKKLDLKVR
jgi:serine/threonine protein kinase